MKRLFLLFFLIILSVSLYAQEAIVFFSDSDTGDKFFDSSFGYETPPSTLELAGNHEKFPVDPQHPYQGAHSLRLHWTSKSGGDWGMALASIGWQNYDFTQYDSIIFWINGPQAISKEYLPDLALEDVNNKKTTRNGLGNFIGGVDSDSTTWQRVSVPIDTFKSGQDGADLTRIKTIYFFQKEADGIEHIAWLDEFRIIKKGGTGSAAPATPKNLVAEGADSRIDLKWTPNTETDLLGYFIYRSENETGPFTKLNSVLHSNNLYSDFIGENGKTFYYKVSAVNRNYQESERSAAVQSSTFHMTDEQLLTSIQKATFRYFWDYAHPVSGLARERMGSGNVCTTGGTGFGLMTIMVGASRGFVPRDSAAARTLKILRFLQEKATRYHGAWSHWMNGVTGETIPFSQFDDGGDLVETAYVAQALLTIRNYYTSDNEAEKEIRARATQLWEEIDWNWYRRYPNNTKLFWHWSPNYDWKMNMPIQGWNEAMIVYLLAIASPTHGVPASLYDDGWAARADYANGNTYYGYKLWVGWPYGGPLFFTHYSFLGFDPRGISDGFCNYFENNRNTTLIDRGYCIANPNHHKGYGPLVWGLTASDDPWGYRAHDPQNDNGTITPTAAISAMPYAPEESIATLKNFYFTYGPKLWGEFGFRDAFNLDANWFAKSYLAIDEGTIVPMIENYRTQLCWDLFMSNAEIDSMIKKIGFQTVVAEKASPVVRSFHLSQNYPNPFNGATLISFYLPETKIVTIKIFDAMGRTIAIPMKKKKFTPGTHQIRFLAERLSSGLYFYRIQAGSFEKTKKMIVLR